ncbi:MAG: ABC transporter ATP-binding protein [Clostridiales bacterium]|nr:ABC transporter ATP-binding protein [Clostridiales bacterium]
MSYFETENLAVGYHGNILIHGINITLQKGQILTLIGPNGAGKSTILKSITRQLRTISGSVYVQGQAMLRWSARELASHLAVVLTDRINPELMTCRELVALGRYPHTNAVGKLTAEDRRKVDEALALVGGEDLTEQEFSTLSDGQKQRMLLARAICQGTEIIVLDEPTAYLDIRYKVELLDVLRRLAREKGTTILLSLHEIDLAYKVSDQLICVKGDTISRYGPPEEVLAGDAAQRLYDMERGSYDPLFGSVELPRPEGEPKVFVVGGAGYGVPVCRRLQREQIPFAVGILFENDVDTSVARALAAEVFTVPAFEPVSEEGFAAARDAMLRIGAVLDAGCPVGTFNQCNRRLLDVAREAKLPVFTDVNQFTIHNL